ncbi:adenylate kinase [Candidatus Woesearchaeota archaeon]|nr:adenylate kinase [Candidatus Woesearchaeota archaeon]
MFKLVLLGPPGAGKGTQADVLGSKYGIPHISTGNIFRDHITRQTDLGKQVQHLLSRGDLVPDDVTNELVRDRLARNDCAAGFILDGYPRTTDQAKFLKRLARITAVVEIAVPEETVVKRLSSRWMCACGRAYGLVSDTPRKRGQCDSCDAQLFQRNDDKPEVIRHRFQVYRESTQPLVEFYKGENRYLRVDGAGSIQDVTKRISDALVRHVAHVVG